MLVEYYLYGSDQPRPTQVQMAKWFDVSRRTIASDIHLIHETAFEGAKAGDRISGMIGMVFRQFERDLQLLDESLKATRPGTKDRLDHIKASSQITERFLDTLRELGFLKKIATDVNVRHFGPGQLVKAILLAQEKGYTDVQEAKAERELPSSN